MAKNFGIVLLLAVCQTIIGLVVGKLPECQDVCIVFLNLYYVFQLTWKIYIYIYIYISGGNIFNGSQEQLIHSLVIRNVLFNSSLENNS